MRLTQIEDMSTGTLKIIDLSVDASGIVARVKGESPVAIPLPGKRADSPLGTVGMSQITGNQSGRAAAVYHALEKARASGQNEVEMWDETSGQWFSVKI